jgi:hypothetical protein
MSVWFNKQNLSDKKTCLFSRAKNTKVNKSDGYLPSCSSYFHSISGGDAISKVLLDIRGCALYSAQ